MRGVGAFKTVYDERMSARVGPIVVYTRPNGLDHPRLGLSVPRAVGSAVARNRIKRRLREAFRHAQHDLPGAYDVVINVRRHEALPADEYRRHLADVIERLHRRWTRRNGPSPPSRDA